MSDYIKDMFIEVRDKKKDNIDSVELIELIKEGLDTRWRQATSRKEKENTHRKSSRIFAGTAQVCTHRSLGGSRIYGARSNKQTFFCDWRRPLN